MSRGELGERLTNAVSNGVFDFFDGLNDDEMESLGDLDQFELAERLSNIALVILSQFVEEKVLPCLACNGTGHYDNTGSPKCESCNGTGKK